MSAERPLVALAERTWRLPAVLAALLMAAGGPLQSLGALRAVALVVEGAIACAAVAVVLGLIALKENR